MKMNIIRLVIVLCFVFIRNTICEEGCIFSATNGELKCELLTSTDFTPFIPADDRDLVRWLSLYVGTSDQYHTNNLSPILYPDLSIFEKLSFLRVYIYPDTSSTNYSPYMFSSTPGAISVISLYTVQAVPFDVSRIGTQDNLEKLKRLSVTGFNISGVTTGNLAGLLGLESLLLSNTEGEWVEHILLDSVFKLGETLPKLKKLTLEDFEFYPLMTSSILLTPLHTLESLTLKMTSPTGSFDESVFFDNRIFPVLKELQLLGFEFSHFENVNSFLSMPPIIKLRLQSVSIHSLPLSSIARPEGGAGNLEELNLNNFNIGNLTHTILKNLPNLRNLYLSGSEDTIEITDGTFVSNKQLNRLRLANMPNLETISSEALIGLTKLTYLHLGNLNSLRTLSTNTSSLYQLTSLYLTSNRELIYVPVEIFIPMVSLTTLNVRSSKFDEDCTCQHSYLSSLLMFSRAEPQFSLSSSCHDNKNFIKCTKNYQNTMCWDFEDKCPHFCIPSGNLSYACACPIGQGDLEEGAACVELSTCGVSADGVASHYCHTDRFSCVSHLVNQTISCSCYDDHVLHPDSISCRSLDGCTEDGDVFRCQGEGLVCDDKSCVCIEGTIWDPVSKTCLEPSTTIESSTTTTTPEVTTIPVESTTSTTTETVASTTEGVASTTETVTSTTEGVTSTPETVASTTEGVTSTPETVATTTETVASTTEGVTSTPETVASTTEGVTSTPETVATTTETVASTTEGVTSTPETVATTTEGVTSTPETVASTTEGITSTPETVAGTTETEESTTEAVTTPEETTSTTVHIEITTSTPSDISIQETDQTTTDQQTPITEPTILPSFIPLRSDLTYIIALTIVGFYVGSVILVLIIMVVVLLLKILVYNRNSKYKVNIPESMRSFESSNSSSTPSAFKELSV
ncbi:hypothetical protein LOD99_15824 [Oopsacas minuta]|uniref:Uncharacterized protein n=1 Tax=Oopsacas minuta TaxID=111878 RepID=A0AAV7KAN7_9METZ|nr:hypothetical protein LOD99_15824 [Oopsacas minuta]